MKKLLLILLVIIQSMSLLAQEKDAIGRKKGAPENWFVVDKTTKLYEQPSVKGDVAISMKGTEIVAEPGMVFRIVSENGVWCKVEYVTGINAYISNDTRRADNSLKAAGAGEYTIVGTSEPVSVKAVDDKRFVLTDNGTDYKGRKIGNILVFKDNTGNIAYTVVDTGNKVVVYDYLKFGW